MRPSALLEVELSITYICSMHIKVNFGLWRLGARPWPEHAGKRKECRTLATSTGHPDGEEPLRAPVGTYAAEKREECE